MNKHFKRMLVNGKKGLASALALTTLLTVGAAGVPAAQAADPLLLTVDGKPNAQIVLPAGASDMEKYAAEELQYHAQLVSGATLPITTQSSTGGTELSAKLVADTITTVSGAYYYSVQVLLDNPTASPANLTLSADGITFQGDNAADGKVTVAAGTSTVVSGLMTVTDAHTFREKEVQITVANGGETLETLTLTLEGWSVNIGTALKDDFTSGADNWTATPGADIVEPEPEPDANSFRVTLDSTQDRAASGCLTIEDTGTAIYDENLSLTSGNLYKLTFRAKADAAAAIYATVADQGTAAPYSLRDKISVGTEWGEYELSFVADPGSDANYAASQLLFESLGGTVWVDDVTLTDCGTAPGSVLFDSDQAADPNFDRGMTHWYAVGGTTVGHLAEGGYCCTDSNKKYCLQFNSNGAMEYGRFVAAEPGKTYTISFWAKAQSGVNGQIEVIAHQYNGSTSFGTETTPQYAVTEEWTRYSHTFKAPASGFNRFYVSISATTDGIMWVDGFNIIDTSAADTADDAGTSAASGSLKLEGIGEAVYGQNLSLASGNLYKLTFWAKADAATALYATVADQETQASYSLRDKISVGTEWGEYELSFVADPGSDAGYSTSWLLFDSLGGTVWIDDVTLADCGKAPGSILFTSDYAADPSFEKGLYPWNADTMGIGYLDYGAYSGTYCMRLNTEGGAGYDQFVAAEPNTTYTISFWAKALNDENGTLSANAQQYNDNGHVKTETTPNFPITMEWARYSYTFTSQSNTTKIYFGIGVDTTGMLVDNFSVIDTSAAATSTVVSSDFDTLNGWASASQEPELATKGAMTRDEAIGHDGASLRLDAAVTADHGQSMPLVSGNLYRLRFWAKADTEKPLTVTVSDQTTTGTAPASLRSTVSVGESWKAYEFRFVANVSEAENFAFSQFAVSTDGAGSVWLDDVTIVDCGKASKNILDNTSFEKGVSLPWYTDGLGSQANEGYTDSYAMKLMATDWVAYLGYEQNLTAVGDRSYTVRFWGQSTDDTAFFRVIPKQFGTSYQELLLEPDTPKFNLTNEWTRYEYTFHTLEACQYFWFNFEVRGADVIIDNITFVDTTAADTADGTIPEVAIPDPLPTPPAISAPTSPENTVVIATVESLPTLAEMFDLTALTDERYYLYPDNEKMQGYDGFSIQKKGNAIYIIGANEKGALNGVYDFIEENMGIIWMRADDTAYTAQPSIAVTKTGYIEESPFALRGWHASGYGDANQFHSDPDTELMLSRNKLGAKFAETYNMNLWPWQQSIGLMPFSLGHNISEWITSAPTAYNSSDKNYWCTDAEGNPLSSSADYQVNFWYEGTAEAIAESVNAFLDANDYLEYVGVGINDSLYYTCRPYDQKKFNFVTGEVVEDNVPYDPETMVRPEDGDEYLSTVFFTMLNKVACAVKEEHPDVTLTTYAYFFTETPPRCEVEKNICVVFCPIYEDLSKPLDTDRDPNKTILENIETWSERTSNLAFYNYYGCFPDAAAEYERPIAERIQDDLQYYAENGYTGTIPEGRVDSTATYENGKGENVTYADGWAMNSLTFWLYGKLTWNPWEDIEALTKEFCDKVYGSASDAMQEYYRLLKAGWDAGKDTASLSWETQAQSYIIQFVQNPGLGDEMLAALDRAWNAADDLAKSRIRYIRETFGASLNKYSTDSYETATAVKTAADKETILSTFDMADPIWANAPVLDNFFDSDTKKMMEGISTKVRLLWDEEYLYVAYENFDNDIENIVTDDTMNEAGTWWDYSCDVETYLTADPSVILYCYFGNPSNLHFRYHGKTVYDTPEDLDFDSVVEIINEDGTENDRWVIIQAISFESLGITEPATQDTDVYANFYRCHRYPATYETKYYNVGWNGSPVWDGAYLSKVELLGEDAVSKSALQSLVNANADLVESEYTSESWTAFQNAMTNANAVLANDAATQEQVDAAKAALEAAIAGLTKTAPITSTTTEAKVDEKLSDEKKAEIEKAIGETTITAGASGLHTDAGDIADSVTETKDTVITTENGEEKTAETVVSELANANNNMTAVGEANPVEIAVVTYLDVKVTDATTTEDGKVSITVDITPMAQTVATTKEVLDSDADITYGEAANNNAVAIGEPEEIKNVTEAVEITLAIPASMAVADGDGYKPLYVTHVKDNGSSYIYEATVSEDNGTYFAIFTNTNGFSKFTLLATNPTVATIGSKNYGNLQSAVNDVKDNETITIAEGDYDASDLTAVVTRPVSFTVANGSSCSITAGANLQISWNGTTCTVTTATVTPPAPITYAVTLVPNGGTINAGLISSYTYGVGAVLPTDVTLPGYAFGGWYATPDFSGEPVTVISATDFGAKTFYAKWTYIPSFFEPTPTPEKPSVDLDDILPAILPFTDVANASWYYNDVYYVWQNGLMNGTGSGKFSPGASLNRAMLVTTLYRLAGSPNVTSSTTFKDLPNGEWYTDAMKWAVENDIIRGYGDNTCKPLAEITHEQIIAVLHRYAKLMNKEGKTNGSTAGFDFSSWAKADVKWANANGLLNGFGTDISDLTETAIRAEIAAYLHRFAEFLK